MNNYTGVQVAEDVDTEVVAQLLSDGFLPLTRTQGILTDEAFPNSFVIFNSEIGTAVARVSPNGEKLLLIREGLKAAGIKPRNQEQMMLLSTLLDDRIPVQIIAGRAGTGKTLLTLAAAMQKVDDGIYNKIILTKPMSQVGKHEIGHLPGTLEEKFAPFLTNYSSNVEELFGGIRRREDAKKPKEPKKNSAKKMAKDAARTFEQQQTGLQSAMAEFFNRYNVELVPLQLMRGASFNKAFIIADEIQVLDHHEMLTLGTRVAEGSKLVLMGDLNQRDDRIARNATGLYKTINDAGMKESSLVSHIELQKVERGPVAELFAKVFEQ